MATKGNEANERVGGLLVNLGTPDRADARALRVYLKEFLSDPRVIENQGLVWKLILNGIILMDGTRRSDNVGDNAIKIEISVCHDPACQYFACEYRNPDHGSTRQLQHPARFARPELYSGFPFFF